MFTILFFLTGKRKIPAITPKIISISGTILTMDIDSNNIDVNNAGSALLSFVNHPYYIFSDHIPNLTNQFVDLIIPEIPHICCKYNSNKNHIIERFQFNNKNNNENIDFELKKNDISENYFTPICLKEINIQLISENNEIYDSNNSDHSFEFEFIILNEDIF